MVPEKAIGAETSCSWALMAESCDTQAAPANGTKALSLVCVCVCVCVLWVCVSVCASQYRQITYSACTSQVMQLIIEGRERIRE